MGRGSNAFKKNNNVLIEVMPKVSIIIPTYNRASVLSRAIESVLLQDMTDWELIICDDCSIDNTKDIVSRYLENDDRIKYICAESNGGPAMARNIGIGMALGEYVAFLDSDDEWYPDKLLKQVKMMDSQPLSVGICIGGAYIIKNKDYSKKILYSPKREWEEDTYNRYISGKIKFLTPTILIRKTCLDDYGMFDPHMRVYEDIEILIRMFRIVGLCVLKDPVSIIYMDTNKNVNCENFENAIFKCVGYSDRIENDLGSKVKRRFVSSLYRDLIIVKICNDRCCMSHMMNFMRSMVISDLLLVIAAKFKWYIKKSKKLSYKLLAHELCLL